MNKFKVTGRYGKADTWGIGIAIVFTEGIVLAFGPWFLELDW